MPQAKSVQEPVHESQGVTPAEAMDAMCMIAVPGELMRLLMVQATQEGISPAQLVAEAISVRLRKTESTSISGRRLLTEEK